VNASAQKRNNVWAFGVKSGLDFNTTPVSLFQSIVEEKTSPYVISSICDIEGNLLFYTDGIKVWNSYNQLLPKYKNWWPWSNKVLPLICPYPSNDSLYYLFGIDNGIHSGELMYLTIKMNDPSEFNEIVYPTPADASSYYTSLSRGHSMVLTGTAHCNQKDVWITTYSAGTFVSYLITSTGVNNVPVRTPVSPTILSAVIDVKNTNIKFSANSEKLVVPLFTENKLVVFDFNNQSGQFSAAIKLSLPAGHTLEDFELSPDGSKLYLAAYEVIDNETGREAHYVYQMDLNAGTASDIEKTIFRLNGSGDIAVCSPRGSCIYVKRTLHLGPDGKIYVNMKEYTSANLDRAMSVMEDPNKQGVFARYRKSLLNLGQQYKYINYNYIRSASYSLKLNGIKYQKQTCADKPVEFGVLFNRIDSVKWNFGDASSGSQNFSISFSPAHQYPNSGTYTVQAIIYNRCLVDTAVATVTIQEDKAVKVPDFIKDTLICIGNQLSIDAATAYANTYRWENGLIYSKRTIDQAGRYEITIMNDCSIVSKDFEVAYKECECSVFVPNAFTPNNDFRNDVFKPVFKCFPKEYELRIFDRYGGVIFQTKEVNEGWNGQKGTSQFQTGVYIWMLRYKNPNTKELVQKNGTLTLIR